MITKVSQAATAQQQQTAEALAPLDVENPKRNAILLAAAQLFLERGYEPVSMDAIADEANVSKRTVYSYFASKSELFSAIMIAHCNSMGGIALPAQPSGDPPGKVLTQFGEVFVRMITSPRAVAMQRIIFHESGRLPEIGETFFKAGPWRHIERLSAYLKQADKEGVLKVPDTVYASLLFMSTVKAPFHLHQLCSVTKTVDEKAIKKSVAQAVAFFLSVYGRPPK